MKPEEENIARLLKKRLPSLQQETEAGKRVFYRLLLAHNETPATSSPTDEDLLWRSRPRLSMAVRLSAAAATLVFVIVLMSVLWRPAQYPDHGDESVLASNSAGRMLDLPDGSQVEMRAHSQLRVDNASDGLRVRLSEGSIIVTAARQGTGHLYVETKDAMVSVMGTIFVVTVEQTGSRVGVIEGFVTVRSGAISQKLLPAQQVITNPAMEQVPLESQVSWSRSAAIYLALLHPFVPAAHPAQPLTAAAPAAVPQSRQAAPSENTLEADSLLIIGPANYGVGLGAAFGNNRRGPAPDGQGRSLFASTPEAERAMEQALVSRETFTDLSFLAEINYFELNRAEYFVPVTLKIPGTQLAGSEKAKRISLEFIGQAKDEYGTVISNFRDALDIQLTDERAKELTARQIAYSSGFTLLPGRYSLKFLVRDRITDRMGTYQTDFVVPSLMKETQNLPISSVVLSSELINPGDALSNSTQPSALDPLLIEGKKLIPSSTRTFSKRRDLIVFLQAYEPNTTATAPLTASVAFYRGQTKVLETPPLIVKDDLGVRWRTLPVKLRVPLSSLPVGQYDCQVTVLDPATQKSAVWRSTINVVN
jgi:hypothetical protein